MFNISTALQCCWWEDHARSRDRPSQKELVKGLVSERSGMSDTDDTTLIAIEDKGLLINNLKTSCMYVHGEGNIKIDNDEIENVEKFKLLGSYITAEGDSDSETEINIRLAMARGATSDLVTDISKDLESTLDLKC